MSAPAAKAYDPKEVEAGWYPWWENSGYFKPLSDRVPETDAERFVIVIPPPNVTGHLHLGHALTGAVQDTLIRYHRMRGHNTLYLPGTDHAGIATQVVAEKKLQATEGKSRHDLGRDAFLEKVWEYTRNNGGAIRNQLRLIGSSVDWSRERFTLDEQCGKAVIEAFVRFHEDGVLYRATRLVNWCCGLQSAISDLEVEYEDVEVNSFSRVPNYAKAVEMGRLVKVAYKVVGMDAEVVVATTRPETILGDTAVAIHPEDPRYKALHGKRLQCPFRDEDIPLICDATLVDMNFGTGAVKVTPAHDPNDFESGLRHNLEQLSILDLKGFIKHNPRFGEFQGMHRFDCRRAIVEALEKKGLLRGIEPYKNRVGFCSRTKDIVEPMLMPQWFVDCRDMAAKAVAAVRSKELRLTPDSHEVIWYNWLENIKPWCVSRQLWWGHRIPAYLVQRDGTPIRGDDSWIVARDLAEAKVKAAKAFGLTTEEAEACTYAQDPDVLDTWFSSALWPFSTMGWPDKTPDMARFFPGSLLETGHDILFFWVARMVMTSLHFTGQLPFTEVYLHAMVRDKDGEKMSKSKGNVIDPLDVISGITLENLHAKVQNSNLDAKEIPKALKYQKEAFPSGIPECGSDALRFGLLSYTQSGKNVNLDIQRVYGYRTFCNKLWNVIRYVLYYSVGENFTPKVIRPEDKHTLPFECQWILSRLDLMAEECNAGFSPGTYDFAATTNSAYRFWLYEFCDIFVELTKSYKDLPADDSTKIIVQSTLVYVVEVALRILHPMMPFLSEELWHRLPHASTFATPSIMLAEYPQPSGWRDAKIEAEMKTVMDVVGAIRSMKASYQLTDKHRPDCWIGSQTSEAIALLNANKAQIQALSVSGTVAVVPSSEEATLPRGCGFASISKELGLHMMLVGFIDAKKELDKLTKNVQGIQKQIEGMNKKMQIPDYEKKVPLDVQAGNTEKLQGLNTQLAQLEEAVERMKLML